MGDGTNFLFHSLVFCPLLQSLSHSSPDSQRARFALKYVPAPDLPVTHGSIRRFYDKGLLFAFPPQLLHIVLELGVLCGEDPGSGYEVVLLRLALAHSEEKKQKQTERMESR